jgi:hypothetical protein
MPRGKIKLPSPFQVSASLIAELVARGHQFKEITNYTQHKPHPSPLDDILLQAYGTIQLLRSKVETLQLELTLAQNQKTAPIEAKPTNEEGTFDLG